MSGTKTFPFQTLGLTSLNSRKSSVPTRLRVPPRAESALALSFAHTTVPQRVLPHELAVVCGDALLRTACAYLDDSSGRAPDHYRSLGRSAFLKAALNADAKLGRIASSFDFLLSVSPINTTAALEKFVADGEQVMPSFRYRPLTVDPDAVKRRLYRLDFSRLEDPLLERLFTDKRHEIDAQLTMLATRNTPSFRPASMTPPTVCWR